MSEPDTLLKCVTALVAAGLWISANQAEAKDSKVLVAAVQELVDLVDLAQPSPNSPPRAVVPNETAWTPKTKMLQGLTASSELASQASQAAEEERQALQQQLNSLQEHLLEKEEEQKARDEMMVQQLEEQKARDEMMVQQLKEQKARDEMVVQQLKVQAEQMEGLQPVGTSTSLHSFSYATVVDVLRKQYPITDMHQFEWMKDLDAPESPTDFDRKPWAVSWEKESCTQSAMGLILAHMRRSRQPCAQIFDTHAKVTLRRGLKPDFTLYPAGGVHSSAGVLATVEVKVRPKPDGARNDDALRADFSLGQALVYCAEVLADQPDFSLRVHRPFPAPSVPFSVHFTSSKAFVLQFRTLARVFSTCSYHSLHCQLGLFASGRGTQAARRSLHLHLVCRATSSPAL